MKQGFIAEGTTCNSCGEIIKRQAMKVEGVTDITFNYSTETGYVTFDENKTNIDEILYKIEEKHYKCYLLDEVAQAHKNNDKVIAWGMGIIGILIVGYFLFDFIDGIELPQISQNMGLGLLFAVGLLTGFHCISMCGGFVISYTTKNAQAGKKNHTSHLMYGVGKTLSYTIIGAIFGLVGSIIAFTPQMRGIAGILAGLFLVLFGLKMLNIFPVLRKIHIKPPKVLNRFLGKKSKEDSSPLMIGLLNGLMIACGPLQAIYIMAAGTGSALEGAKLLLVFGLGTLPAMIGFGYFASFISTKATHKILKTSGVIVIILGFLMLNNGLVLTGTGYDAKTMLTSVSATSGISADTDLKGMTQINDEYQEIRMDVTRYGWSPDKFILKKDVPVRWIINGLEITGCNNAIQVPKYNLKFDIKKGEQVIEFTPTEEGVIPWSCWMGMIPGTFVVKSDIDINNKDVVKQELEQVQVPKGGSCGGSTGGCGCGG